ncbi:ABC transporter ATP-binding protein [Patulibacter minatonensis]|uniref:ABC transporter ATP-binding protein n=1 Tax=Patulibacter minatonensis TaxID=298163 RepID=UPI0005600A2E|nr:ABC transporter ATP-binding protein [Patulibacter minatonensis]
MSADLATRPETAPVATGAPLLEVRGLRVAVPGADGPVDAVHGVDLRVGRGEALGLVGESGSGKTLTCRAVLGVLPGRCTVAGGTIDLDGTDLATLSPRAWRDVHAVRIGAVFQDPASYLNPAQTVGRQLAEVLRVKTGLGRRAARARALELFATVGLKRPEVVFDRIAAHLSGGMQQRVMLAIAISCDPQLLIADEPTTALDVKTQAEIVRLLRELRERIGLAILFVSHDLAVVTELCDRIAVFRDGRIVEEAPTAELLAGRAEHPYTRSLLRAAGLETTTPEDDRVA